MRVFTFNDYVRMYQARGLAFCFSYFMQVHRFDLLHGVDTHTRIDVSDYSEKPDGFDHGIWYVCSRTDEIRNAFRTVAGLLGDSFTDYQFFDLGAGKGKSLLVYYQMFKDTHKHTAVGLEYYEPLMRVCKDNIRQLGGEDRVAGYTDDARNIRKYTQSNKLILYLYNPFDWNILGEVIRQVSSDNVVIIYIDPVCSNMLIEEGYSVVSSKVGKYPNQCVTIFKNS